MIGNGGERGHVSGGLNSRCRLTLLVATPAASQRKRRGRVHVQVSGGTTTLSTCQQRIRRKRFSDTKLPSRIVSLCARTRSSTSEEVVDSNNRGDGEEKRRRTRKVKVKESGGDVVKRPRKRKLTRRSNDIIRDRIKGSKSEDKIWRIIIQYSNYLDTSLMCLALVRVRRLSKRRRKGDMSEANRKLKIKGTRVLFSLIRKKEKNMNAKHIATILHSMAALRMTHAHQRDLRRGLIDRFFLLIDGANGQSIGNMLWACGKLEPDYPDQTSLEEVVKRLLAVSSSCNSQNFSNTIWALGTMNQRLDDHTLELLLVSYTCKVHESVPQGMSNVLWAMARLDYSPQSDIFDRIVSELMSRPEREIKAQDLANATWSLGRLQCKIEEENLEKLIMSSVETIDTFNQQELSLTLWGLARLDYRLDNALYSKVLDAVGAKCHTFNAQALSTTLWAVGRIGIIPSPEVLFTITEEVSAKIRTFTPQGLSNVLWSLTSLSYNPGPSILRTISLEVSRKSPNISSKNLSSILKSFSILQYLPEDAIMQKLTESFLKEVEIAVPQSTCQLLWSFASLGYSPGLDVLDILHLRASTLLDEYTTIHLANTLWSYSTLSFDPGESFLSRLVDSFVLQVKEASPQAIANIVWAIASLGYGLKGNQHAPILEEVCSRIRRGNQFSVQELTNIVWAFSVMGMREKKDPNFDQLWQYSLDSVATEGPGRKLAQLFHSKLLLEAQNEESGTNKGRYTLPRSVNSLAEQSWNTVVLKEAILSRFHGQVSSSLKRLKVAHKVEQLTRNKYLSVDILLPDHNLVVEVDGPSHFSMNTLRMSGSTLARNRLLEHWSYSVICIPYFGWPSSEQAQDKFLSMLLKPYCGEKTK